MFLKFSIFCYFFEIWDFTKDFTKDSLVKALVKSQISREKIIKNLCNHFFQKHFSSWKKSFWKKIRFFYIFISRDQSLKVSMRNSYCKSKTQPHSNFRDFYRCLVTLLKYYVRIIFTSQRAVMYCNAFATGAVCYSL